MLIQIKHAMDRGAAMTRLDDAMAALLALAAAVPQLEDPAIGTSHSWKIPIERFLSMGSQQSPWGFLGCPWVILG